MRLLVSVASASEAASARRGGADIVDAKDPRTGALGAVPLDVFREIKRAAGGLPTSAAIGDHARPEALARMAAAFVAAGAAFVKIGFAGTDSPARIEEMLKAAAAAAGAESIIAVTYADHHMVASAPPAAIAVAAAGAGVRGILVDTADKRGPSLLDQWQPDALHVWIENCRHAQLLVALAGRVAYQHAAAIGHLNPDVVGVRGAVCDGPRTGTVSEARIRELKAHLETARQVSRFASRSN